MDDKIRSIPFYDEELVPPAIPDFDNDLADDNLENDIPEADLETE